MCIQTVLEIKKIQGDRAIMDDGREVLLGTVRAVPGEHLSVYANVAIAKIATRKEYRHEK
jgi:hypothetical protein